MKKDMPTLNVISFSVYYGVRTIGALIFVISLIPVSLIFGRIFPEFFMNASAWVDTYVVEESERLDKDWVRLGGSLK